MGSSIGESVEQLQQQVTTLQESIDHKNHQIERLKAKIRRRDHTIEKLITNESYAAATTTTVRNDDAIAFLSQIKLI